MSRDDLARRQAELLDALLAGGPPPAGFDPFRLAVEADALRAKRRRIAQTLRSDLVAALEGRFTELFAAYARAHPRRTGVSARQDAAEFERWLIDRGDLPRRPRRRRWGR